MLKKEKNFFVLFEMHKYCNLKWKLNDKEIIETNPNRLFFFKYEEWDHTSLIIIIIITINLFMFVCFHYL